MKILLKNDSLCTNNLKLLNKYSLPALKEVACDIFQEEIGKFTFSSLEVVWEEVLIQETGELFEGITDVIASAGTNDGEIILKLSPFYGVVMYMPDNYKLGNIIDEKDLSIVL